MDSAPSVDRKTDVTKGNLARYPSVTNLIMTTDIECLRTSEP